VIVWLFLDAILATHRIYGRGRIDARDAANSHQQFHFISRKWEEIKKERTTILAKNTFKFRAAALTF